MTNPAAASWASIAQPLTYALMPAFFRNDMGFGGIRI
jgi:hypothetical protein